MEPKTLHLEVVITMSVKPMAGLDMDNRDPNNLGEHIQVIVKCLGFNFPTVTKSISIYYLYF